MTMSPGLRKVALTAHITSSIGWFGAVAAFLALAIAGLFSQDRELVRAAYLVMGLTTWFVIVPLALVSLLSGVVSSLGTRWGLFRYYWVLLKLVLTVLSVYKPRGMTRYGQRKQDEKRQGAATVDAANDQTQGIVHEREDNDVHAATFK